jgi:hypothetical protein
MASSGTATRARTTEIATMPLDPRPERLVSRVARYSPATTEPNSATRAPTANAGMITMLMVSPSRTSWAPVPRTAGARP